MAATANWVDLAFQESRNSCVKAQLGGAASGDRQTPTGGAASEAVELFRDGDDAGGAGRLASGRIPSVHRGADDCSCDLLAVRGGERGRREGEELAGAAPDEADKQQFGDNEGGAGRQVAGASDDLCADAEESGRRLEFEEVDDTIPELSICRKNGVGFRCSHAAMAVLRAGGQRRGRLDKLIEELSEICGKPATGPRTADPPESSTATLSRVRAQRDPKSAFRKVLAAHLGHRWASRQYMLLDARAEGR